MHLSLRIFDSSLFLRAEGHLRPLCLKGFLHFNPALQCKDIGETPLRNRRTSPMVSSLGILINAEIKSSPLQPSPEKTHLQPPVDHPFSRFCCTGPAFVSALRSAMVQLTMAPAHGPADCAADCAAAAAASGQGGRCAARRDWQLVTGNEGSEKK